MSKILTFFALNVIFNRGIMKKIIVYIISIVLIVCVLIIANLYKNKQYLLEIQKFNLKYEKYIKNNIVGTEVASIINQAVDDNENEAIKKDENGRYSHNNETSINIEIKITEFKEEQIYTMESLYNGGIIEFVKFYGQIPFKATKVEYNKNKRIKYILFEQIISK